MKKAIISLFLISVILLSACGKPLMDSSMQMITEPQEDQFAEVPRSEDQESIANLFDNKDERSTDELSTGAVNEYDQNIQESETETLTYEKWRDSSDRLEICLIRSAEMRDYSFTAYDVNETPLLSSKNAPLKKGIVDWDANWLPSAYSWEEYCEVLLPQLWEDDVALQDLCALYLKELYMFENFAPEMTIESFVEFLKAANRPETEVFRNNLQRLEKLADTQKGRFEPIEGTAAVDLDGDGVDEIITLQVQENIAVSIEATLQEYKLTLQEYKLFVNGALVQTFLYESMNAYILDLDTCKVIYIRPEGRSDVSPETEPERARRSYWCDALFGFANGRVYYIGAIDGHYTMYIGEGRFLAAGEFRFEPSHADNRCVCYAVKSFAKEYGVPDGTRMYRLSNNWYDQYSYSVSGVGGVGPVDWQQNNTVWTLCHDLPLYELDGITISDQVLKSGSTIIIRGISANGYLFVCDEEGNGGVIRLIWPVEEPENPYAAPGGQRLIYYFSHFDNLVRVE